MTDTVLKHVQVEKRSNGIAVITLRRPEAANALSRQMLNELHNIVYDLKNNPRHSSGHPDRCRRKSVLCRGGLKRT